MDELTLNNFSTVYLALRKKENRIFSKEEIAVLPVIKKDHALYKEWKIRKASAERLLSHIQTKHKYLDVLEVGCGNGWLCNQISQIRDTQVIGLDINKFELDQAK